jgi:hypothetical protein
VKKRQSRNRRKNLQSLLDILKEKGPQGINASQRGRCQKHLSIVIWRNERFAVDFAKETLNLGH